MKDNFDACMQVVFEREGGYTCHPMDPGSHTNMGITIYTLSEHRKKECTADDIKNLTKKEASDIYKEMFWEPMSCDDLPYGVDLSVFAMGVNSGFVNGSKILQKIVGSNPDGIIGPKTIDSVDSYCSSNGAKALIAAYRDSSINYYKSLKTFQYFGNGWINRANIVFDASIKMNQGK